jgi:hypothetical protein
MRRNFGTSESVADEATRFWASVDVRGPDECWPWTGNLTGGYGRFLSQGIRVRAHRMAYELAVDTIPAGLTVDHECHNADASCPGGDSCPHRSCCNPVHLVPRSGRENTLRSPSSTATVNAAKTHCPQGHEFTPENTYVFAEGKRRCRECRRRIQAARRAALKNNRLPRCSVAEAGQAADEGEDTRD